MPKANHALYTLAFKLKIITKEVGNNCEIVIHNATDESLVHQNENKIFTSQEVKDEDLEDQFETDSDPEDE